MRDHTSFVAGSREKARDQPKVNFGGGDEEEMPGQNIGQSQECHARQGPGGGVRRRLGERGSLHLWRKCLENTAIEAEEEPLLKEKKDPFPNPKRRSNLGKG